MYLLVLTAIVALTSQQQTHLVDTRQGVNASQQHMQPEDTRRDIKSLPIPIEIAAPSSLKTTFNSIDTDANSPFGNDRSVVCPQVAVTNTDSNFQDGQYILQAGFAQGESLGATYYVPPGDFPIKIDLIETIFATSNATVQTTTHWSVTVWDGTPTDGFIVASYSSDDIIIPHLVMPPGTGGTIISVSVDPQDPEQIFILNDSGTNAFTVAFRVDQHNSPGTPCISSPPINLNAFPVTDTGGLQFPLDNWIDAVNGTFCLCGTGWMTFLDLPGMCTPTGDWVIRAAYTPINCNETPTACCVPGNACIDLIPSECIIFGGTPAADGSTCATYICGSGVGACCIPSTGGCVDFDLSNCLIVGGIHAGEGTTCATTVCFPVGACCLPTGACLESVSPDDCITVGGIFQGDGISCLAASCPQPIGACCSSTWCLDLIESDCVSVGGNWSGAGTICENSGGCAPACIEDLNGDGSIDVIDLLTVVADWGSTTSNADINGNGIVDTPDILAVIGAWGLCL